MDDTPEFSDRHSWVKNVFFSIGEVRRASQFADGSCYQKTGEDTAG
jgi:hypothetical protein